MLKKLSLHLCFLSLLLLAVGCATTRPLGSIPHEEQDFKLSMEELKAKYPEISVYERKGFFIGYRTPIKEVIDQWGEADKKSVQLLPHGLMFSALALGGVLSGGIEGPLIGAGIVMGMYPVPSSIYTWEKGDYVIEAGVDSSIFGGYMKRLWFWEWKGKRETKAIEAIPESDRFPEKK